MNQEKKRSFNSLSLLILFCFLAVSGFMLFWNLGSYSLWDDESMTSLASQGILQTGDTSAVHGKNITAFRGGLLLRDLHDRSTPPLSAYLAALPIKILGPTSFAARLPFAVIGFALMCCFAFYAWKDRLRPSTILVVAIAILGNVSLMLFLRQSRYYAPAVLLSTLIAMFYVKEGWGKRKAFWITALIILLFCASYLNCAALVCCLGIDYYFWERHENRISTGLLVKVGGITVFGCLLVALMWNPFACKYGAYVQSVSVWERFRFFVLSFRDMDAAQFMVGGVILASVVLAFIKRDAWLWRGLMVVMVYTASVSLLSPQVTTLSLLADIRYLVPLIPVFIALGVRTLLLLCGSHRVIFVILAILCFWTNPLHAPSTVKKEHRFIALEFIRELLLPIKEPYRPTADWINTHLSEGDTIWVLPDYMAYPLMYLAPKAVYAWQLNAHQQGEDQYKNLPQIHFKGMAMPDYIIVFGPQVKQVLKMIEEYRAKGILYKEVDMIDAYWRDVYRPELFWRSFRSIEGYDLETEAVYVFKHMPSPTR